MDMNAILWYKGENLKYMDSVMLIADISKPEALGSKLLRAGLKAKEHYSHIQIEYNSPDCLYSPSMKSIMGKIYYRMNGKKTKEWRRFSLELKRKIRLIKPHFIVVTNILPLGEECFREARRQNSQIINYLIDDPWNPIHKNKAFISEISNYDHIYSTQKQRIGKLLKEGAKQVSWLPCAYDPEIHFQPRDQWNWSGDEDIIFIGTGAQERNRWLGSLSNEPNINKVIYGNSWESCKIKGWKYKNEVQGSEYCEKIYNAKITIGLLREGNKDKSTDRSYEIGAIGGCGIYQDTKEHRQLLYDYPEIGFFKTPQELKEKSLEIMKDRELQKILRIKAANCVRKHENTFEHRLNTLTGKVS